MRISKVTPEMREYIRTHWGQVSTELMGRRFGVSSTTVSAVAHKMGCPRLARGYEGFVPTPEQADYIRDNWGSLPLRAVARHVGVSYEAVRRAGREMGLPQLRAAPRPVMAARVATKPVAPPAEPQPLPVIESDFIRAPTKAQLMAGR